MTASLVPLNVTAPTFTAMDIVFVHGLGGHWKETWQKEEYSFWPSWLSNRFPMCRMWSFDYPSAASGWTGSGMTVVDRANNFWSCLNTASIGDYPIVFITHSLGGLVTKALLRTIKDQEHLSYVDPILSKTVGIVFFGTPHQGSFFATLATRLPSFVFQQTPSLTDLQAGDHHLADLNTWFRTFASDRKLPMKVFAETQPTGGVGLVVDQASADPGIPRVIPIPVDASHTTICKFASESETTYLTVCKFIDERLSDARPAFANRQAEGGLSIHLGIDNAPVGYGDSAITLPLDLTQRYKIQRKADSIRIYSDIPYLDRFSRGGPVMGLNWTWTPFATSFPALDFKVANNSSEAVFLSEAEFTFEFSRPNSIVALLFRDNVHNGIVVVNEGSGTARQADIQFNFQPIEEQPDFSSEYRHRLSVGDIVDSTDIDLAGVLQQLESEYPKVLSDAIIASAEQSGSVLAAGRISWMKPNEDEVCYCDFSTRVFVGQPAVGLPGPPTCSYDLQIKSDGANYSETVPVSQYIKPGENDRFQIVIFCESPSSHRFRCVLRSTTDVVFTSPMISMDYFVTASGRNRAYPRTRE